VKLKYIANVHHRLTEFVLCVTFMCITQT